MAKGPAKTKRIAKHLRRNPEAPHVKAWHAYREKKGKPKAKPKTGHGQPLTLERYKALIKDYQKRASDALYLKNKPADAEVNAGTTRLRRIIKKPHMSLTDFFKTSDRLKKVEENIRRKYGLPSQSGVSGPKLGYKIASEIITDFGRTKGLNVFGFGVGYAQLSFFLKKFMGAKTKGVEMYGYSQKFTRDKKLGIKHGINAGDPILKKMGKFDVTYSINTVQEGVIDRKTAQKTWDNLAYMTRKGGKSYHIFTSQNEALVMISRKELEKRGFKIDSWEELGYHFFIKLTKVKD